MPVFNAANQTSNAVIGAYVNALKAHRDALIDINNLYVYLSGLQLADLEAAPYSLSPTDANALLSAMADAHAEYMIHTTGQAPGSYPQVTGPYQYAASQTEIIGANP